jgi:flavin reductase (DIM6/NTAB) family NADH-FMN oxidoreductase RutF
MVADGDPPLVLGLINDTTDLFESIVANKAFVVHVADTGHQRYSEAFAGLRPSPGGLFVSLDVDDGPYGPVISDLRVRAYCRLDGVTRAGSHRIVAGRIEQADLGEPDAPLVRFRGRYRELND